LAEEDEIIRKPASADIGAALAARSKTPEARLVGKQL